MVCRADRIDLVEKLLNGEYIEVNEVIWGNVTLLGVAKSIEMADVLIGHGAVLKGDGFDCFKNYITRQRLYMLEHFFNHHEFIYRYIYI